MSELDALRSEVARLRAANLRLIQQHIDNHAECWAKEYAEHEWQDMLADRARLEARVQELATYCFEPASQGIVGVVCRICRRVGTSSTTVPHAADCLLAPASPAAEPAPADPTES